MDESDVAARKQSSHICRHQQLRLRGGAVDSKRKGNSGCGACGWHRGNILQILSRQKPNSNFASLPRFPKTEPRHASPSLSPSRHENASFYRHELIQGSEDLTSYSGLG